MSFEIERKVLVRKDDWRTTSAGSSCIRQACLTTNDKASIRVRIKDEKVATLTVKSRGAELRRLELEDSIPDPDYPNLSAGLDRIAARSR